MLSPRLLIIFFRKDSLLQVFMWLMGFGIIILLDNLATIWLASIIGAFLAVAAVGMLTWMNLAIIFASLSRHIRLARACAAKASDTDLQFKHIIALVISALLVISPGILSDLLAWAIYLPPVRLGVGKLVLVRNRREFDQLHQHLAVDEP